MIKKRHSFFNVRGFLLIESLIAITMLSIGLALIVHSFANSLHAGRLSQDYMTAVSYLEQKINEIENEDMTAGEFEGTFDDRFFWKAKITPLASPAPAVLEDEEREKDEAEQKDEEMKFFLDKVTLKVFWKIKNKQKEIAVTTYLKGNDPSEEKEEKGE
ncbi:hypothetical protein ACFLQ1_00310 [Candidatus Auribacterota bacterium]